MIFGRHVQVSVDGEFKPVDERRQQVTVLAGKDVRLEIGGATYVDSAFVGLVMLLQGHQTQHGRQLLIFSPQKPVRRIIKYCCAEYLCLSTG